jgi:glyoxylase-like metal-dependent hydrolase (beta-lactamase superfamily II)
MKIWTTVSGYKIIQVLAGRSNVFLLADKENSILIDTSPKFMWNRLQSRLRHLKVDKIDYLILTHTHFDHAANSRVFIPSHGFAKPRSLVEKDFKKRAQLKDKTGLNSK